MQDMIFSYTNFKYYNNLIILTSYDEPGIKNCKTLRCFFKQSIKPYLHAFEDQGQRLRIEFNISMNMEHLNVKCLVGLLRP